MDTLQVHVPAGADDERGGGGRGKRRRRRIPERNARIQEDVIPFHKLIKIHKQHNESAQVIMIDGTLFYCMKLQYTDMNE